MGDTSPRSGTGEHDKLVGHKDDELTPKQLMPYRVVNFVLFVAVAVVNALGSAGTLTGRDVANISDSYPNSFVPAGWAFAIWGPIYLWVAAFCIYMAVLPAQTEAARLLTGVGPWFAISCVFNIAWIVTFVFGTPVAVLISTIWLFLILIPLLVIMVKIDSWRSVRASLWDLWLVDITFSMYAGWCTVACIANVVVTAKGYGGWDGSPWTEQGWSVLMIGIAAAINVAVLASRQDPVFALVFTWAAAAIADGHRDEREVYLAAAITSGLVGAGALGVAIYHVVRWAGRLQSRAKHTAGGPAGEVGVGGGDSDGGGAAAADEKADPTV